MREDMLGVSVQCEGVKDGMREDMLGVSVQCEGCQGQQVAGLFLPGPLPQGWEVWTCSLLWIAGV